MESLIAPVLDFMCPSSWVSNPEWISRLHSILVYYECSNFSYFFMALKEQMQNVDH